MKLLFVLLLMPAIPNQQVHQSYWVLESIQWTQSDIDDASFLDKYGYSYFLVLCQNNKAFEGWVRLIKNKRGQIKVDAARSSVSAGHWHVNDDSYYVTIAFAKPKDKDLVKTIIKDAKDTGRTIIVRDHYLLSRNRYWPVQNKLVSAKGYRFKSIKLSNLDQTPSLICN